MWPPPEFQLLSNYSSTPTRLRPNNAQGEVVPNQGKRLTGWVKITLSTGIWGGWWQWKKWTPHLPPVGHRSGPEPKYTIWTISDGGPIDDPKEGDVFELPEDDAYLGNIPMMIYVNDMDREDVLRLKDFSRILTPYFSWLTRTSQGGSPTWCPGP